jgi:hypothetical protein
MSFQKEKKYCMAHHHSMKMGQQAYIDNVALVTIIDIYACEHSPYKCKPKRRTNMRFCAQ